MPRLIRTTKPETAKLAPLSALNRTPRERRLYYALTVITSLNVLMLSGAATFWALLTSRVDWP